MASRPRRRPRKRDIRLDAALKAMHPFGFPEDLVQVTVRELLNDNSSQHEVGDTDYREDATAGLSIPTCSNSGATDAMLQANQALDTASQPNEAPDSAHESYGRYYLPLAVSSVGTEPLGNSLPHHLYM
uniref:Uncharacterized protein n=1 Tax=Quercus lobata TaxID=97700 RepID=A0A7N2L2P7_QUELO